MSDAQATFNTVISATDKTGPVIARVRTEIAAVSKQAGELGAVTQRLGLTGVFTSMRGAVAGATGAVRTIRSEVGSLATTVTSLVPALAGLTGLAGVGGIFKLTADVAEASEKFGNLAASLNLTRAQLGSFNFLAKQTGTDTEAMATGFARFERNVFKAATGGDKGLAGTFKAVGLSLRDSTGQVRSLADMSDDLFKVFQVNSPEARQFLAQSFFGRGGKELLSLFRLPEDARRELIETWKTIMPTLTPEGIKGLDKFKEEWISLGAAVGAVKIQLGAALAPTLLPVLKDMRMWLAGHRDEMVSATSGGIIGALAFLGTWWDQHRSGLTEMVGLVDRVTSAFGGWQRILSVLMGVAIGRFVLTIAMGLARITGLAWLAGAAIAGVKTAIDVGGSAAAAASGAAARAERSAGRETAESVGGGLAGGMAGSKLSRGLSLLTRWGGPLAAFLYMMRPSSTQSDSDERAGISAANAAARRAVVGPGEGSSGWMTRNLPRISFPTPYDPFEERRLNLLTIRHSREPITSGAYGGQVQVNIDVTGLPRGTTVQTQTDGNTRATVRLNGDNGLAFSGMP